MSEENLADLRKRGPYAKTANRRRSILEAATKVFAERGYQASSLREVATAAGISLSNLVHHFGSKEEILLAVLRQRDDDGTRASMSKTADDLYRQILDQAKTNETRSVLTALFAVLSAESTTLGHPARDYFFARYRRVREDYVQVFSKLQEQGRLREGVDPQKAAASVVALWDGLQLQWLLDPEQVSVAEHLHDFLDLLITSSPAASLT